MKTNPTKHLRRLADKIAADLFTPGSDNRRKCDHLKLFKEGRYMGGWCEKAMADRIYMHLLADAGLPRKRGGK